ncbi:MAG: dienelactone hydrolase family protein [Planctomycetes bacterium]|nr:dienelactone hydrolase family protein [Planctomycetota bacterium]
MRTRREWTFGLCAGLWTALHVGGAYTAEEKSGTEAKPVPEAKAEPAAAVPARASEGKGGKAGVFADEKLKVGERERAYRLVVPENLDPKKPAPLVFAFHGGIIDSKELMPVYSQLDALAKKEKFILVYPNADNKIGWWLVKALAQGDIRFFDELLKRLSAQYNVDLNRVYCTGMSSGGFFCHLLASERSEKIAAIAAHSAGLGALAGGVDPQKKTAVLVLHGAKDPVISVEEGRKARDAYQKAGFPVKYVEYPDVGHHWALFQGVNETIWKFFVEHPLGCKAPEGKK